jgi:6-phosphogluconolactonase
MSAIQNASRPREILVFPNPESLANAAAELFVRSAAASIQNHGAFIVALSGGSTPKRLFEILATDNFQAKIDWNRVYLFWGDERYVPSDHPDSNFRMTMDTLLSKVPIPHANVHRIRTELSPAEAVATNYESEIARFFTSFSDKHRERFPAFDLVLLGVGTNAHTASLFPHSQVLQETSHLVAAEFVAEVGMWRITMTAPLLNAAREIVFLVHGKEKAQVVREVLFGDYDPERKPAQMIQPANGRLKWLIDSASAAKLPAESYQKIDFTNK